MNMTGTSAVFLYLMMSYYVFDVPTENGENLVT